MMNQHIGEVVFNADQIKVGVSQVAEQLNKKFGHDNVVIITVVPGGILFTADLVRQLNFDVSMDYISCPHTPGERNNASAIVYHQNINITDRHVVLVDDAIESGGTMKRIVEFLAQNYTTKSISVATLFVKPGRVNIPIDQHFTYEMENDDLLVGYGLPWNDKYRNMPFISQLIK
ncbi:MAG: phosphoribosyltransferase family protein [Tolumonas sp.]|nr:phosphoribosyltransferase family protein [Tolumonas sp.]